MDALQYLEAEVRRNGDAARAIAHKAEKENRGMTPAERKEVEAYVVEVTNLKNRITDLQANKAILEAIAGSDKLAMQSTGDGHPVGGSYWMSAKAAGAAAVPGQVVRAYCALDARGTKGLLDPADSDGQAATPPGIVVPGVAPLQVSKRYAYPIFGTQNIGVGDSSVTYLQQYDRQLAESSEGVMDFASTAQKPTTYSNVRLVTEPAKMIATLSDYIPNAYWARDDLRNVVDEDLRLALNTMLDDYVVSAIQDNPDTDATPGADLIEAIVYAQQELADNGFAPSVTLLSSSDATAIKLARSSATDEFFSKMPDLGQLRVCDRLIDGMPIVIDPQAFGTLYLGATAFDVDSVTEFDTNQSRARAEFPALLVVRRPEAAAVGSIASV